MVLGGIRGINLESGTQRDLDTITDLRRPGRTTYFSSRFFRFLAIKKIYLRRNYERFSQLSLTGANGDRRGIL